MKKKSKYIAGVTGLLLAVTALSLYEAPDKNRVHQHLSYNTEVEDTNLSIDEESFTTRLPVVSIDTGGAEIPGRVAEDEEPGDILNTTILARAEIFENEGKQNSLSQKPVIDSDIEIRIRGNSSRRFDKAGYLVKFRDKKGGSRSYPVMGMEEASTWVLNGPFLDKTLMRNYMWYNLSGEIMEWAPDVRYCEVFLNREYQGVYIMVEQIDAGKGRIDITPYKKPAQVTSYILRSDRPDINSLDAQIDHFTKYTDQMEATMDIRYPDGEDLTPELKRYIEEDFSRFEKALYSYDYDTKQYGYWNNLDVDSFVDYYLIGEIVQNTDAGIHSSYLYKDVSGKLKMAVWDFNNCADNYTLQSYSVSGFYMTDRPWMYMLTKDEKFINRFIERYRELREGILSDDQIRKYIDQTRAYLGCAIDRNFQVWGYTFEPEYNLLQGEGREITSYEGAISQYENRILERCSWMDQHIEELRQYCHESKVKQYNH